MVRILVTLPSKLSGAGSRVVTPEEMELSMLRTENFRLKRENEILKINPYQRYGKLRSFVKFQHHLRCAPACVAAAGIRSMAGRHLAFMLRNSATDTWACHLGGCNFFSPHFNARP